jgi:hypothetical protein
MAAVRAGPGVAAARVMGRLDRRLGSRVDGSMNGGVNSRVSSRLRGGHRGGVGRGHRGGVGRGPSRASCCLLRDRPVRDRAGDRRSGQR